MIHDLEIMGVVMLGWAIGAAIGIRIVGPALWWLLWLGLVNKEQR
jgi:hypothetical protein